MTRMNSRVEVRLPDGIDEALDEEVRRRRQLTGERTSRSEVVRDALSDYLNVDGVDLE